MKIAVTIPTTSNKVELFFTVRDTTEDTEWGASVDGTPFVAMFHNKTESEATGEYTTKFHHSVVIASLDQSKPLSDYTNGTVTLDGPDWVTDARRVSIFCKSAQQELVPLSAEQVIEVAPPPPPPVSPPPEIELLDLYSLDPAAMVMIQNPPGSNHYIKASDVYGASYDSYATMGIDNSYSRGFYDDKDTAVSEATLNSVLPFHLVSVQAPSWSLNNTATIAFQNTPAAYIGTYMLTPEVGYSRIGSDNLWVTSEDETTCAHLFRVLVAPLDKVLTIVSQPATSSELPVVSIADRDLTTAPPETWYMVIGACPPQGHHIYMADGMHQITEKVGPELSIGTNTVNNMTSDYDVSYIRLNPQPDLNEPIDGVSEYYGCLKY